MNIIRPPAGPRSFQRPPEDVDGLLRAFIRSEMPDPWPAMPALPEASPRITAPKTSRWYHPGSRFALAATLAACLIGSLTLASMFPSQAPPTNDPADKMSDVAFDATSVLRRVKPITTISPDHHKVRLWEKEKGNKTIMRLERVEPELEDMP
jgi:hypothetical protein